VFRHLDDLAAGDSVRVAMSDGSTVDYVVTDVTQVPKSALPAETWSRDGEPRLVLITCGGVFDSAAGSYEDNVVASARPA
jgi:LPXTG-site transpeptidase (sortase) family protein